MDGTGKRFIELKPKVMLCQQLMACQRKERLIAVTLLLLMLANVDAI
jgi:hypothetical protein